MTWTPELVIRLTLLAGGILLGIVVAIMAIKSKGQDESAGCILFVLALFAIGMVLVGVPW